ncbi:hypothetical protein GWK47_010768 [Chionoecetes opilio]|uniref:Uncharacterized protein n=1 Tax=Chionoecetes opilio TaxID=41210 RepID=A0A8J4Y480_CHIOP|nr:hypothetical protein GWK47_010768 [Chionoecetes opilio]
MASSSTRTFLEENTELVDMCAVCGDFQSRSTIHKEINSSLTYRQRPTSSTQHEKNKSKKNAYSQKKKQSEGQNPSRRCQWQTDGGLTIHTPVHRSEPDDLDQKPNMLVPSDQLQSVGQTKITPLNDPNWVGPKPDFPEVYANRTGGWGPLGYGCPSNIIRIINPRERQKLK